MAGYWWDPDNEGLSVWAAYRPYGADDLAHSYMDLFGNGNNVTEGVTAPDWDAATGWEFDGVGDYLVTTFVPANDQSQTVIVQFSGVANNGWLCGMDNGADRRFGIVPDDGAAAVAYYNGGTQAIGPALLAGNLGVAGSEPYRAGADDGASLGAWGVATALATFIGAINNGVGASFCECTIEALVIYDTALTAAQVAKVAAAMQAMVEAEIFISVWNNSIWSYLDIQLTETVNALCTGAEDGRVLGMYNLYAGMEDTGSAKVAGSATITYNGTARAWPVLTIDRDGDGEAVITSLRNETTGEWVAFNYELVDGEELVIDFAARKLTSTFAGSVVSSMLAGDLFALQPGENVITLLVRKTEYPTITARMTWRDAYLSAD